MRKSDELENAAIIDCSQLMAAAARTAPKTRGIDNIVVCVIDDGKDIKNIARVMREIAVRESRPSMERDAGTIENLSMLFLLGVKNNPAGLNCGFCGCKTCEELASKHGICSFNSIDLGIALCSAVAAANQFHIDNRIMYSIGKAALETGVFSKEVTQILGVPLSVSGKSPFFDRK